MTRKQRKPKQERKINNMKTKIISRILLSLGLVFVLGSAITQVRGDTEIQPPGQLLVATIHSSGDIHRGKTGSFVVDMRQSTSSEKGSYIPYFPYVNFSVSGTAIPGVDYISLVSPAQVGPDGYGVILVKTLPDPRGLQRSYTVVVTLDTGLGYTLGAPTSAKMTILP
jgi:hypothetical protein